MPSIDDLLVARKSAEVFEVSSWITRGRCATVYKFAFGKKFSVSPFLIKSYMGGITTELIVDAVEAFLAKEQERKNQNNSSLSLAI